MWQVDRYNSTIKVRFQGLEGVFHIYLPPSFPNDLLFQKVKAERSRICWRPSWMLCSLSVLTKIWVVSVGSNSHIIMKGNSFSSIIKYGKITRKLITSTFPNPLNYPYKMQKTTVRVQTLFQGPENWPASQQMVYLDVSSRSRLANSPANFWGSEHTALMIISHWKF